MFLSSTNYLNSLDDKYVQTIPADEIEKSFQAEPVPETLDNPFPTSTIEEMYQQQQQQQHQVQTGSTTNVHDSLIATASSTPDDHYAKNHPGAGWAGYKHPNFGGYLDNLNENTFEEGKKADYGDDIRWGAQVYLDRLGGKTD